MASLIIKFAKVVVFLAVVASAMVSLYSAVDAMAVHTDLSVFTSGLLVIIVGVPVGPLFCFVAGYGLVYFLGFPVWEAVLITAPVLIAWCVVAVRTFAGFVTR